MNIMIKFWKSSNFGSEMERLTSEIAQQPHQQKIWTATLSTLKLYVRIFSARAPVPTCK
jgi:hypothetical protein